MKENELLKNLKKVIIYLLIIIILFLSITFFITLGYSISSANHYSFIK